MVLYGLPEPLDRRDSLLHFRGVHLDIHRGFTVLGKIDFVRPVGSHLDDNADHHVLLVAVVFGNLQRDGGILGNLTQGGMIDSLLLQSVASGRQPQNRFAVVF